MNKVWLIILIVFILLSHTVLPKLFRLLEKKRYNNGKCPKCGCKLYYFGDDSQSGHGYTCTNFNCKYTTWFS